MSLCTLSLYIVYCVQLYNFFGHLSPQILCPFLIGLFVFLLINYKKSLYILHGNLFDIWSQLFSLIMGALCTFLMVLFEAKGFNFDKARLSTFFFLLLLLPFAVVAKKLLSNSHPQRFTSLFSSRNCII